MSGCLVKTASLQLVAAWTSTGNSERGCPKEAMVQKVCRAARDEREVREVLDAMWGKPGEASGVIVELGRKNQDLYRFEKTLEEGRESNGQGSHVVP